MAQLIATNQLTLTNVDDGTGLANVTNFYLASNKSTGIDKPADIFNLIRNGAYPTNTNYWSGAMIVSQHNFYYKGQKKLFLLQTASTAEVTASTNRFEVKRNTDYTISFYAFSSSRVKSSDVWFLGRKSGETNNYTSTNMFIGAMKFSPIKAEYVTVTFNSGDNDNGYIRFDNNGSTDGEMAVMYFGEVMLGEGKEPKPWVSSILDSGWTITPQPISNDNHFLWNYRIELYTDGTTRVTEPAVIGVYGDQGIPGPKGADGKTPYIHFAYADNADGTGLTLTDNGQRYIGQYSDYTQADSTDKTKYRWADRWAKIEVGGENLVDKTGEPFVMGYGITNTTWNPETKRTRLTFGTGIELAKAGEILPQGGIFETQNVVIQKNQTYTQAIRVATDATFLGRGDLVFTWFGPEVISNTNGHRHYPASIRKIGVNEYLIWSTVTWDRPDIKLRPFDIYNLHTALDFRNSGTFLEFYQPKLETGTIPTAHTLSQNDRQSQIDSKADQALTDQQLNLLIEKAQLMETELKARAAMETLSELERAYNAYVEANDKAVKKSEADLIEAGRRVDVLVETLGGLSKTKKFIDTYIKEAEEGIIIGTNDNVSQIRVTYNRIAMYSAGKEVMYISQGVIHIDNGVFTKSLQVGRFRTEQHPTNLDINVCRYVG